MNIHDELRLAHQHVKNLQSSPSSFMEPYRSMLNCCVVILDVIRNSFLLPSPLPREDEDWLKGFDTSLSHGVSSSDID